MTASEKSESAWRVWLGAAVLGAAFFAVAYLCLTFARESGRVAVVWPANAFLLVAIMRLSHGRQVPYLLAAWAGNIAANAMMGDPLPEAAFLSALNIGEASLCAYVIRRFIGERIDFTRPRDLIVFTVGAFVAPLASGVLAAAYLSLAHSRSFGDNLLTWWPTDAIGLLIFSPALFILIDRDSRQWVKPVPLRRLVLMGSALAAGLCIAFLQSRLPLLFLIPPILGWITLELGLIGAAWGTLAIALFSIIALIAGRGPTVLAGPDLASRVGMLQFYLGFLAFTTFPLAAFVSVRSRLEGSLEEARSLAEGAARQLSEAVYVATQAERIAGMGYWLYRPRNQEISWSDGMYDLYGLEHTGSPPTLETVINLFHPDDRSSIRDFVLRSLDTGEAYELQLRVMRGAEMRWVIASTRCQFDEAGGVTAVIGTMIDVTSMRRTEAALVESEIRYRTLADMVPDLILRQAPNGTITFASAAAKLYGYDPKEVVGRSVLDFVHPDDLAGVKERFADNFSSNPIDPTIRREQRMRTADGQWVWLEGNPVQVRDESGQVIEVVNALRDVTRRRALEDELLEARIVAEQANQAKSEFLSNMSHELRTPLAAIVGFAELLKHTGKLGEREAMFVGRIASASSVLHGLVNDILDFSKMEAGGVLLETVPIDLDRLIDESLSMVASAASGKKLALSAKVDGTIKTIIGDPTRLRQILVNLLSNAVKFTDKGSVRLKVSPAADGLVRFEVTDTGVGIPADRLDRIFERFTQADGSTTRSYGGTGLGLAICKGLVQAMGGRITVTSKVGTGSTFAFTIAETLIGDNAPAREAEAKVEG